MTATTRTLSVALPVRAGWPLDVWSGADLMALLPVVAWHVVDPVSARPWLAPRSEFATDADCYVLGRTPLDRVWSLDLAVGWARLFRRAEHVQRGTVALWTDDDAQVRLRGLARLGTGNRWGKKVEISHA
jgi:hypothetical protein